jgi:hypothetical protein
MLNILRARAVAKKYWILGYAVICPHLNSALFDGVVPDDNFLEGGKEIVRRLDPATDCLVLMKNWDKSAGAGMEAAIAYALGIEVVYD